MSTFKSNEFLKFKLKKFRIEILVFRFKNNHLKVKYQNLDEISILIKIFIFKYYYKELKKKFSDSNIKSEIQISF
jgi:hypothetical protein